MSHFKLFLETLFLLDGMSSFIFFYLQNTLRRFFCPKLFGRIKNRKKIVIAGWIKEILSEKTQIEKSRLVRLMAIATLN